MTIEEDDVIDGVARGAGPIAAGVSAAEAKNMGQPAGGVSAAGAVQRPADAGLAGIARELAAAPPVDSAKVERLRDAIVAGEYRPDPEAIAAAMLALEARGPERG